MDAPGKEPARKRRRTALSCENCRSRKLKCDRKEPCEACMKSHMDACVYKDGHRLARQPVVLNGTSEPPGTAQNASSGSATQPPFSQEPTMHQIPMPSWTISSRPPGPSPQAQDRPVPIEHLTQNLEIPGVAHPLEVVEPHEHLARQKIQQVQKDGIGLLGSLRFGDVRGTYSKERFYGPSHWMNYLQEHRGFFHFVLSAREYLMDWNLDGQTIDVDLVSQCPSVAGISKSLATEDLSDIGDLLVKCKCLVHDIKAIESPEQLSAHQSDRELLPDREVADALVQAYLRTFETIFRMLYIPSFWREYLDFWRNQLSASPNFLITLQLVLAIGSVVCAEHELNRWTACHWIQLAQAWLSSLRSKWRSSIDGIRTQCLLLLARQVNGVDGGTADTALGSASQLAMQMGLHIDPAHYPRGTFSDAYADLRRRLWATIMELELHSCMDAGGSPHLRDEDYDCAPPANRDDKSRHPMAAGWPSGPDLPIQEFTSSSIQILLAKSLPLRLKIARFVNDFRPGSRYQEALALSAGLIAEMRQYSLLVEGYRKAGAPITLFQVEVFNLLMHRFLLALHHGFAIASRTDSTFYYSRKLCLDSALALLSPPPKERDADFHRLILHGKSVYEDVYTQAVTFLCDEVCSGPVDSFMPATRSVEYGHMALVEQVAELALTRIHTGATNVKGYLLLVCLLGQMNAILEGQDVRACVRVANKSALEIACGALQDSYDKIAPAAAGFDLSGRTSNAVGSSKDDILDWFQWDETFGPGDENWLKELGNISSLG